MTKVKKNMMFFVALSIIALISVYTFFQVNRNIPQEILKFPHTTLKEVSSPVKEINGEIENISLDLEKVIKKTDNQFNIFGLGLAAPQIGYNKRIIVLKESYNNYKTMINPEIVESKWKLPLPTKCLSVKGIHFIKRNLWYKIKYEDIKGKIHEEIITGFKAVAFHQEIDHLNGILISDY